MLRSLTSRLVTLALVVAATALAVDPGPAGAATGSVTVVDLPSEVRAQPRDVEVVGRTDDGHVLVDRQDDPKSYVKTHVLVAPDGSTSSIDEQVAAVVGNRLVQPLDSTPTSVTSRLVGDTSWTTTAVPDGATLLDYTSDGLLLATGASGSEQLSLLPWGDTATVPVDGLPAGADVWELSSRVGHGSLSMLWASGSRLLVVDTSTRNAWTIAPDDPDCATGRGGWWNFGADTLAWQETTATGRVVCTATIPASAQGSVTFTKRPADVLASLFTTYTYRLVPVGDDVLVAPWYAATPAWATEPRISLRAIAPDGTVRTLATAGYGVQPAGPGHVVAVTGEQPGRSSVRDIDVATGDSTLVLPVDPVPASYSGIAVDGDHVYAADDSADQGGLRGGTVDLGSGTAGASALLDTDVKTVVAADDGAVAWTKSGWQGRYGGHLVEGGSPTFNSVYADRTDRRWVFSSGGYLFDTTTGASRYTYWDRYNDGDFQDGVTYVPGQAIPGAPKDVVIAADAATRVATTISVPPCTWVYDLQVAGSWMLVYCKDATGRTADFVVDRTGATPTWRLNAAGEVHLGNGFVVARTSDGIVSWTPLAASAPDWQRLGTAAVPDYARDDHAVSASRGSVPTVAWYSGSSAHVALLPVATSGLPDHPTTGVLPPSAPHVTVVGADRKLKVSWDQADASEAITAFRVAASTRKPGVPNASVSLDVGGGSTGVFLPGPNANLSNGAPYDVTVTAINIAGRATSDPVTGTPIAPPSPPTDVQLSVDPVTSRGTLTWSYTQAKDTEPARSFTINGGPIQQLTVPADSRSASFVVDQPWSGQLMVSSDGLAQHTETWLAASFPGPDSTAPKAAVTGVPKVSFGHRVTLHLSASDDRKLAVGPVDLRWRSATLGHRLGAWQRPAAWQGRDPGTVTAPSLVDGETACYSVRAHDAAGNTSTWSAARCTATPVDDRALTGLRDVTRLRGSRFFHGTATRLNSGRGELRLSGPVAVTGWVLASTCPTCGRVQVVFGGGSFGSVNLRSAKPHDRVLLPIPGPEPQSGRLQLWTTGSRPGVIDAVILQAH